MENTPLFYKSLKLAADRMGQQAKEFLYVNDPVAWAEERLGLVLWSKQKEILRSLALNKRTAVKSCHSIGKDMPLDTPIPTPDGWTTMGEIKEGDFVLGEDGAPTRVVFVSEEMHTVNYEITFSDGTTAIAGADHQWNTIDMRARSRIMSRVTNVDWREHWDSAETRTTEEIVETLKTNGGQNNHLIPVVEPLQLPEADLLIEPYILGAWLGDGCSTSAIIYAAEDGQHILDKFEFAGYKLSHNSDPYGWSFTAGRNVVRSQLKSLGVFGNKHIPIQYLRSSVNQRKALLAGILDTDGFVVNTGSAGIDLANKQLAYDTADLIRSLGIKVNVKEASMSVSGRKVPGTRYRLAFTPTFNPFSPESHKHLKFAASATKSRSRATGRIISSARTVETVTSKCIQVDNARSLYLATDNYIPTHNTYISSIASAWWISTRDNSMVQSTAPTYDQVHAQLWEEIRKLHAQHSLRGRVTLGDEWLAPQAGNGKAKDILVGQGRKPADTNIHGFHGIHRPDGVLSLLDEGCGLNVTLFTGAEAIATAKQDRIMTTGNPDDPNTEFGRIFREGEGEWNLITVSAFDTPNFTSEGDELREQYKDDPDKLAQVEQLLAGMPQPETIESQRKMWGEDSPRYLSKVLAQFPATSIDSLFSPSDIETARNNIIEPDDNAFRVLGVDVARYGEDKTVIAYNAEGHIEILKSMQSMDIMEVAATVHKLALDRQVDEVRVDGVGVGGGVVDRLVQLSSSKGHPYVVIDMQAGSRAPDPSIHRNSRAYWYDSLKHQMRSGNIDIPEGDKTSDAEKLILELGTIKYRYPNGIMQIESKEDIRRRGDKSPDFVDAVVMATAPISQMVESPLASMRPGQMLEIDVMSDLEMVSLY